MSNFKTLQPGVPPVSCQIGPVLLWLRTENGWSLETAAAKGGISPSGLHVIETGRSIPGLDTTERLAVGYDMMFVQLVLEAHRWVQHGPR